MWPRRPEGGRRRRFRDFMLKESVPRTLKVIGLPHLKPKLLCLVNLESDELERNLHEWVENESWKPTEPWRRKERISWMLSNAERLRTIAQGRS
jgi:hypothetical protein